MSTTTQRRQPRRSMRTAPTPTRPARHAPESRRPRPATTILDAVMGGPDRAVALGVIGRADAGLHRYLMGGPDQSTASGVMGQPDTEQRAHAMGEAGPAGLVDFVFTGSRDWRRDLETHGPISASS